MFNAQLLRVKIPKAQKRQSSHQCFFAIMGSLRKKSAHKALVKFISRVNFSNPLAQRTNALALIVWCNQFHQLN